MAKKFCCLLFIVSTVNYVRGFGNLRLEDAYRSLLEDYHMKTSVNRAGPIGVTTKWIDQPMDHFNKSDNRTWKMRYMESLQYWNKSGDPIYLSIGGESELSPLFLMTGFGVNMAEQTHGAIFASEHRYYGQSIPLSMTSNENMKYLSSRQALADVENLLKTIKTDEKFQDSKVVVFGGSYPGSLAAWARMLYPTLIDAAVSSSAPVLAKADFKEYLEVLDADLGKYGTPICAENITNIIESYKQKLNNTQSVQELKKKEEICDNVDLTNVKNQQLFFADKVEKFAYVVQYGTPQRIKNECDYIYNVDHFINYMNPLCYDDDNFCNNYNFEDCIRIMKGKTSMHSWTYQTCTEFGYFQSTSSKTQPFMKTVPVELYYDICKAMFGPEYDEKRVQEGVTKTNQYYGGLSLNVSNVFFTNGDLDPWHKLGVLTDLSDEAPARLIPKSSHCMDLLPASTSDSSELEETRSLVNRKVREWIGK